MTKRLLLFVLLAGSLVFAKSNFTGDWKMDPSKSDAGPMTLPESIVMKIRHDDPGLAVNTKTTGGPMGDSDINFKYTTDGKECTNEVRGSVLKSKLVWDGDVLTVSHKRDFQGNEITFQDRWTLSGDGKTITINRKISSPQGEFEAKTVLNKQ